LNVARGCEQACILRICMCVLKAAAAEMEILRIRALVFKNFDFPGSSLVCVCARGEGLFLLNKNVVPE
jgi:hypothetical protein